LAWVKKREWLTIFSWKLSYIKGYLLMGLSLGIFQWVIYWMNPSINPFSLWIVLAWTFGGGITGYLIGLTRLNKEDKRELKSLLKIKGLEFEISNPIAPENLTSIIHRLFKDIEFYFDRTCSKYPIEYYPQNKTFKIYYDGKLKSKEQILKIIIKRYKDEFLIESII